MGGSYTGCYGLLCRGLNGASAVGSLSYHRLLDDIACSFEVIGDGGEVNLDGGFCDAAPSHAAKAIASFPGAEYLLDPASHPMDWLIPFSELSKRLLFVTTPRRVARGSCTPALSQNRT
jgi:hypothetical protein